MCTGQVQDHIEFHIMKCPDNSGLESQGLGLEKEVLTNMAGFDH